MTDKKRIAIIAGQLVVGGAERQLYLWLAGMDRTGYEPLVVTLHPEHDDYWEKPIEDLGIKLIRIPQRSNRLLRLLEIVKVLREYKPDLIHGWHLFASVYAGLAAKILGTKSIGGIRNAYESLGNHKLELFITLRTVDAVVANSVATAEQIKGKLNSRRVTVYPVQNAIMDDFSPREETRKKLVDVYDLPENAIWIVSMGRMDPLKRFDLLLNSIANLSNKKGNIHLILIGDGPEKAKLEQLTRKLKLTDCVTFTGEVPNAGVWLKGMDIFAFTSVDEGMPNVIMEAAAAELPIVTWRMPFYEQLLENNRSVLLVEPQNLIAFEAAVITLVNKPELREELGSAARAEILSRFSLDVYIKNMTVVYETVLAMDK